MEWNFLLCDDYTKSLGYLSSVLEHEGPNTLTFALNKNNLCNGLSEGSGKYAKTYMTLSTSISFTKKIFESYREVIIN